MPDKSKEKTQGYIHIIRGLISFHERMKLCSLSPTPGCKVDGCPEESKGDLYLDALRYALHLMEQDNMA